MDWDWDLVRSSLGPIVRGAIAGMAVPLEYPAEGAHQRYERPYERFRASYRAARPATAVPEPAAAD